MLSTILHLLLINFTLSNTALPVNYLHSGDIDVEKSTLTWTGKKVVGSHTGQISLKSGHLEFNELDVLTGGQFEIDMTTITCTDLAGKKAENLVGHLMNEDFFEVNKYGSASLKFTEVVPGSEEGYYFINADLTIKGITNAVGFGAHFEGERATAAIKVDRTDYDIKYGSGSYFDDLGDRAIDNDFRIDVDLVLKK